jgi:hypothetical protein
MVWTSGQLRYRISTNNKGTFMLERVKLAASKGITFVEFTGAASYAAVLLWAAGEVVWSAFLNSNTHRSHGNALFIIDVLSPIAGAYLTIIALSLPALAAGACASLTECLLERVPAWLLPIFAAACTIMLRTHLYLVRSEFYVTAEYGPVPQIPAPTFFHILAGHAMLAALYLVPLA